MARRMRSAILCLAEAPSSTAPAPAEIKSLHVASDLAPSSTNVDLTSQQPIEFTNGAGAKISSNSPLLNAALIWLRGQHPRGTGVGELIDQIGIAWFAYYTSGLRIKSGDTLYYARIAKGTDVKIYPFYVGWKMSSATDLLSKVAQNYDEGADGIAVWDPNQFVQWQSGRHPYWPLVSRLGHRDELLDGSLLYKPVATPLIRLGDNHYSRWYPNTGF